MGSTETAIWLLLTYYYMGFILYFESGLFSLNGPSSGNKGVQQELTMTDSFYFLTSTMLVRRRLSELFFVCPFEDECRQPSMPLATLDPRSLRLDCF
jgi:hypothetical protein